MNLAATLAGPICTAGIDARSIGRQNPAAGPGSQPLDRLTGRDGHGHDVGTGLDEREVEQGREATARADLGTGEITVLRPPLRRIQSEFSNVDLPDRLAFPRTGEIEKEHTVEPLGTCQAGRGVRE